MQHANVFVEPMAMVTAAALRGAVAFASDVADHKSSIPVLSCLRIVGTGDTLTVYGTDLDRVHESPVLATTSADFDVLVNAKSLAAVLKPLPAGADLVLAIRDERLSIRAGGLEFNLATHPTDDWPGTDKLFDPRPMTECQTFKTAEFKAIMANVSATISTEETRYYLNGAYFHTRDDGRLAIVSTDGHRLTRYILDKPTSTGGSPEGAIIPRNAIAAMMKRAKRRGSEPDLVLSWDDHVAEFRIGDDVIRTKLVDGTFPIYERVIPSADDRATLEFEGATFADAIKSATAISAKHGRTVKLDMSDDGVIATVDNPEAGNVTVPVPFSAADFPEPGGLTIGFNATYLLDFAKALGKRIVVKVRDAGSPALLFGDDKRMTCVLMPMRV